MKLSWQTAADKYMKNGQRGRMTASCSDHQHAHRMEQSKLYRSGRTTTLSAIQHGILEDDSLSVYMLCSRARACVRKMASLSHCFVILVIE